MRRRLEVATISFALALSLPTACTMHGDFVPIGSAASEMRLQARNGNLDVEIAIGAITLREVDGDTIRVVADVAVRGRKDVTASPKAALTFADWVVLRETNGAVEIRPAHIGDDHKLEVTIEVPRGLRAVRAKIAVGKVDVAVAEATSLTLGADTGEVVCSADAVASMLRADIGAGNFDGAVRRRCGGAAIAVEAGRVVLGLPPDCEGAFDLVADVGDVAGVERLGLTMNRSFASARANGKRGTGTAAFTVRVAAGQILIR